MKVTQENYYSQEVNREYMSFHTWLNFHGCDGIIPCEAKAVAELAGEYEETEENQAFLIGSYVDSWFEGTLEQFKEEHPELFVTRGANIGQLKSTYKVAEKMIERCQKDKLFMAYMSGEKQRIFTAEMFGCKWKCKLDSYIPGKCIVDLKTTREMHKQFYVPDIGHVDFISYYGYVYQLAIYREIVRISTGESLPCFIAAVSKSEHPEIKVIHVDDISLYDALTEVKRSCENTSLLDVWRGSVEPIRCKSPNCHYCVDTEVLTNTINYKDLIGVV